MKYFANYATKFYFFSQDLEEVLYSKKYYKLYVYSRTKRLGIFSLDLANRTENLKEAYIYYLKNPSLLLEKLSVDTEMAKYIKKNVDLNELSVESRCLLNVLEQTYDDVKMILMSKDEDYVNSYLKTVKFFVIEEQKQILNEIYSWAKLTRQLDRDTYEILRNKFTVEYRAKFATLKRLKFLK